jgi:hypothetical protein
MIHNTQVRFIKTTSRPFMLISRVEQLELQSIGSDAIVETSVNTAVDDAPIKYSVPSLDNALAQGAPLPEDEWAFLPQATNK